MHERVIAAGILLLLCARAAGAQTPSRDALAPLSSREALGHHLRTLVPPVPPPAPCIGPELEVRERTRTGGRARAVITGTVTDFGGKEIEGANVYSTAAAVGTQVRAARGFRLEIPTAALAASDSLTLGVRAIYFRPQSHRIALQAGDSLHVNVRMCAFPFRLDESIYTLTDVAPPSIVPEQGDRVGRGRIVRMHGKHLVILHGGNLYTVALAGGSMQPVATVKAVAPGFKGGTWYYDMLVHGDRVIVAAHSWESHGIELTLFRIDDGGNLEYLSTSHHRSNRHSFVDHRPLRIVGDRLAFYSVIDPVGWHGDPEAILPAARPWRSAGDTSAFEVIASPSRVYATPPAAHAPPTRLHTVTSCVMTREPLTCEATTVIAPAASIVHVGTRAVYVWTNERGTRRAVSGEAMLYRLPLDGSAPGSLRVAGVPIDEFSFRETDDGHVDVLIQETGDSAAYRSLAMGVWNLGVLRIPVSGFGDGSSSAPPDSYRELAAMGRGILQYAFVGDHLVYGLTSRSAPDTTTSIVGSVALGGGEPRSTVLPHTIQHIEPMGTEAAVLGERGGKFHVSVMRPGGRPGVAYTFSADGALQEELRSRVPLFEPLGQQAGVLAIPTQEVAAPDLYGADGRAGAMLFLLSDGRSFREAGEVTALWPADGPCSAGCRGGRPISRPLFIDGRIFVLLNGELVEVALRGRRLVETGRVRFAR